MTSTEQATRTPGSWFTTGYAIYQIDELGNPGRLLAQASTLLVAASMVEAHNSMLAALIEVEEFLYDQADADDNRPNDAMRHLLEVREAIARATGGAS